MRAWRPVSLGIGIIMQRLSACISICLLTCALATPLRAEPQPSVAAVNTNIPGALRLRLPPTLYAVVGLETNLYFDNVCLTLNPANWGFDIQCPIGKQQAERWTAVASAKDVGQHPFVLEVRNDQNELVARAESQLVVVSADRATDKPLSLLMVGDSLTHGSVYPQRVWELCQTPGNPKLQLVGSHGLQSPLGDIRHEGYGGWTAQRFATHFTPTARTGDYKLRGSPFLYEQADGSKKLDFAKYCQDVNEGRCPDAVTIFLGPNDIFSYDDLRIEAGIDTMLTHYDQLVTMIHAHDSKVRVGVMLPVPPAASQDAFGSNYTTGQTRWQYKRNQHRLVERMLDHYAGKESEQVFLVPTVVNLDCVRNYPEEVTELNLHAEQGRRQNNGVHPAASGYRQIGDSLYAWLKATTE